MSKNNQRNQSEINLGNETYNRGYADGVAGNPKTIKKTHRHAHRYHIGYRHGVDQAKRETGPVPEVRDLNNVAHQFHKLALDSRTVSIPLTAEDAARVLAKPKGFWSRVLRWFKG